MKRINSLSFAALFALAACGTGGSILNDDGGTDMATPWRLQSGAWQVGSITYVPADDGCMIMPDADPMNLTTGSLFALQNDGKGNIQLGALNATTNQPADGSGTPPQPAQGASCPGAGLNPVQCASEGNAMPFNATMGTLVRDNDVTSGMCMFHRHVTNQVTLTGDNAFTAVFKRKDTNQMGTCTAEPNNCTSTWTWKFSRVKPFGM